MLVFQHFQLPVHFIQYKCPLFVKRIVEFKKTRKIDLTEVKQGAFKKVVIEVVDLEEEDDEEDNDEEELLAYLEDLKEREEDEEEVTLNELA